MERHKELKVMMIDDEIASHTFHEIMIEDAGQHKFQVEKYLSVDAALNKLQSSLPEHLPELILLDLNMPIKSGWDFIEEFKQLNLEGYQPMIYIVTSSENPAEIHRIDNIPEVKGHKRKFLDQTFFKEIYNEFCVSLEGQ